MSRERPKSPRARLFVALDLPDEIRQEIAAWGREALADPALRPIPAESLHITLAFLGYKPEKEVERIAEVVRESVGPAPWVELLDPAQRPPRGRARLFALPVLSPGTESLQEGLEQRLTDRGRRSSPTHLESCQKGFPRRFLASDWRFIVLNSSRLVRAMCRWPKSSCPGQGGSEVIEDGR